MAISDIREYAHLSQADIDALGEAFDKIRKEIEGMLGADDAAYIRRMITLQRRLASPARVTLFASAFPPAWVAGTAMLGVAKILENIEIGHNVMHGQWDWMNDPEIHSSTWEWDTIQPAEQWRHSHNYIHHTFTNVHRQGQRRRLRHHARDAATRSGAPAHIGKPVWNLLLALLFQWGVGLHDLDIEGVRQGTKDKNELRGQLKQIGRKVRKQVGQGLPALPRC